MLKKEKRLYLKRNTLHIKRFSSDSSMGVQVTQQDRMFRAGQTNCSMIRRTTVRLTEHYA